MWELHRWAEFITGTDITEQFYLVGCTSTQHFHREVNFLTVHLALAFDSPC
jgi:hypothetical protein